MRTLEVVKTLSWVCGGHGLASILYCVSTNRPPSACYIFNTHERILLIFDRNVTEKAICPKSITFPTLPK